MAVALLACDGSGQMGSGESPDAGLGADAGARPICEDGDLLAEEQAAFVADFEATGAYHVYGIELEGDAPGCLLRLTEELLWPSQDNRRVQWSADGRWLMFHDDFSLQVVELGEEPFPIAQRLSPETHQAGSFFEISPDGSWVGWDGRDQGDSDEQAYLSPLGPELPATAIRLNEIISADSTAGIGAWSPEGSSLLLSQRDMDGGRWKLVWVEFDEGEPRDPISLGTGQLGNVLTYAWSPVGDRVMFVAIEGLNVSSLYVVDLSSAEPSAPRRLHATSPEGQAVFDPVWSPDGAWILFVLRIGTGPETDSELVLADPRGEVASQVVSANDTIRDYGWIDADTMYLTPSESAQSTPLQLVEIAGDKAGSPEEVSGSGASAGMVTLSPDRRYLIFAGPQNLETAPSVGLFVLDLASSEEGPTALLPDLPAGAEVRPTTDRNWSADSTMFAFVLRDGSEQGLHVARLTGSEWSSTPVSQNLAVDRLVGFSPHSHRLAFRATRNDENPGYYVVDPDAPSPEPIRIHEELRLTSQAYELQWRPAP